MIQVKVCGLSTAAAIDASVRAGASHVGFVSFAASPRHLPADSLAALAARVPSHVARVAVLVDPADEQLSAIAPHVDAVQLHRTAPARVAAIRARWSRETWAAVPIKTRADLDAARDYAGAADRILYDAKTPEGETLPGGMGLRFDWTLLDGFDHPLPWGLSGGLDPANIAEAIARTRAPLVDVSSGVESAPGVKDVDKIAAFLQSARR